MKTYQQINVMGDNSACIEQSCQYLIALSMEPGANAIGSLIILNQKYFQKKSDLQ